MPREHDDSGARLVQSGVDARHDVVAGTGQRGGKALSGSSNRAGSDQLTALLGPDTAAAGEDPRRPGFPVVGPPAHDGGVAVGGQRDGGALRGGPNRTGADQLTALLGPDTAAAGEDPRRPGEPVADQLVALLGPDTAAAGVDPGRPGVAAPVSELSKGAPTKAVLPSPDSATDQPCCSGWGLPTAPVPTSLRPCWVQTPLLRVKTHVAPVPPLTDLPFVEPWIDAAVTQRHRQRFYGRLVCTRRLRAASTSFGS
jgi:hypothetical protein